VRSTLADCGKPVLLIWGAVDEVVPVAHAQAAMDMQNVQVNVFADCAHCPHIEQSERFNEVGMKFLGR